MTPPLLSWRQHSAEFGRRVRHGIDSTVGRNVLSLYGLQFANYILPLVTVPYLVRVLGPEKYGAVVFGQGLMAYFIIVVNYGFNWSATRTISVQREDRDAVILTASSVWAAKALICIGALLTLLYLVQIVPRLKAEETLLYFLFGTVVGHVLFPTWLFQGMESMVAISVINFAMRVLTTVAIFGLVHKPDDFLIYALLLSVQWSGAGILGVWIAGRNLNVHFRWPGWRNIVAVLAEGWTLFLSTAAVSLYTTGNTFILGMLTNNVTVGYYGAAERLVKSLLRLLQPITQAVYPRFSRMAEESREEMLYWARKGLFAQSFLGFVLSVSLFAGAPLIVRIFLGGAYGPAVTIFRLLSPLPLLIGISSSLGQFVMLPLHRDRARLVIFTIAGATNIVLALALVPHWSANGMAVAVLSSELVAVISLYIYVKRHKISPI